MRFYIDFTLQDAKKLLFSLIFIEICLVLIFVGHSLLGRPLWQINDLFNLDQEANIPAWFSSVQLFMIGLLLLALTRQQDLPDHPSATFFLFAGALFIFLSMDEAALFHEKISTTLGRPDWLPSFRGQRGFWIPIYLFILLGIFFAGRRDLWAMWNGFRRETLIMVIGLGIFLMGAAGLEVISYEYLRSDAPRFFYWAEVVFEEFFEMLGATIILYGVILFALHKARFPHAKD